MGTDKMEQYNEILISVIIPVFNTPESFFEKCIESVICTKEDFYEIIIVDDGSEESNSQKYHKICRKYHNILYFKKNNGGVSSARNEGIRKARGKYIAFVDADDIVTSNFLPEAKMLAEKHKSDVIIGTMKYENRKWEPQGAEKEINLYESNILSLKKSFLEISQDEISYPIMGSPCGKIYKAEIVKQVMFSEKITHLEDQLFNRKFFDCVQNATLVPDLWYIYNQNDFSAMHNSLPGKYMEKLTPFFEEWDKMNETETDEEIRRNVHIRSIMFFYGAVNDIVAQRGIKLGDRIKKINELYRYPIFENLRKKLSLRCEISKYEKFKLFLIKYRMKYTMLFFVYIRQKLFEL